MAELVLKVSEEKYKDTLNKLQGKLNELKDLKDGLEGKKGQLNNSLKESLGQKASEMLEANLKNVNSSIEKTQTAIDQIQHYLDTMQTTDANLSNSLDSAAQEARNLFD